MDDLKWCIEYLKKFNNIKTLFDVYDFDTLRALENITMPINLSSEYYLRQDKVLKEIIFKNDILDTNNIQFKNNIGIIKGNIAFIKTYAIVNACNSQMLGCFKPQHNCIDNQIHSYSGLEVRRDLMPIMKKLGGFIENGKCIVTKGYNLPSKYIFHTVGPIVENDVTKENEQDLKNCYLSCLKEATKLNLKTIAFPAISTGIFGYPKNLASILAYNTVYNYLKENDNKLKVIFVTYTDIDFNYYKKEELKY